MQQEGNDKKAEGTASIPEHEDIAAPEILPWQQHGYPASHASVHDNPLGNHSVHDLKEILKSKGIPFADCTDKDDLIQRCIEHGITYVVNVVVVVTVVSGCKCCGYCELLF